MSDQPTTSITSAGPVKPKSIVPIGEHGLVLSDLDSLWRFSSIVRDSGVAPKGMDKTETIFVAIQMGLEVGLSPMQSLQNIGVINGRPGIFGDAALALVRASGKVAEYDEEYFGATNTDGFGCRVTSLRIGAKKPIVTEFTVADAKTAKLWGKLGPWTEYPKRMLKWRARGFNLRDNFGDVLKGLRTVEELRDDTTVLDVSATAIPVERQGNLVGEMPQQSQDGAAQQAQGGGDDTSPAAPTLSPQQQLEAICLEAGMTLDDFRDWGAARKYLSKPDDVTTFDEVPTEEAKRIVRVKKLMLEEWQKAKGAK